MPKRRKDETDDMYRARCLAWLMLPRRYRPRRPKQRKGEPWGDYKLRYEMWHGLFAAKPDPEWGRRWQAAREQVSLAAEKQAERYRRWALAEGQFMPFDRPHFTCNQAGLDFLRRGCKHLPREAITCPWLGTPCKFPERSDLLGGAKRKPVGYVRMVRPFPTRQPALFAGFNEPLSDTKFGMCCVEGLERLVSRRRKAGFEVTVCYEESAEVRAEYEALFGLRPCFK